MAGKSKADAMLHYMPEIIWHDRDSLLSVDFQMKHDNHGFYKLVTTSLRQEVRIWKVDFKMLPIGTEDLGVQFVANLIGHHTTVNVARFSPDGKLLVSGDCDGCLIIWKIDSKRPNFTISRYDDFPPNVENWIKYKTPLRHDSDICSLCWSPDSQNFATASNDESVAVYDGNIGKRLWHVKSYRRFPNGIVWDPRGKYIVTMSTDRKLDILCAKTGNRLICIQNVNLPRTVIGKSILGASDHKLFHDDQLMSFCRISDFSPDGELLVAPCMGRPVAFIPSTKATFRVSFNPVFYTLHKNIELNCLQLPYRMMWAVLTKDTVTIYDSQLCRCIACASNLQYDTLTDIKWSDDGRVLMISSLEGYISFMRFGELALGMQYVDNIPSPPPSPILMTRKKRKEETTSKLKDKKPYSSSVHHVTNTREGSPPNSLVKIFRRMQQQKNNENKSAEDGRKNSEDNLETLKNKLKKRGKLVQLPS
ncbi:unnamed protein product [Thelazia callipaeda]|uniref:WD_REPEATS_REGION domain-containing protein n=1 Tax=Thelazia callipaeda TaxID=103827 RepID=A0A0N5D177_THECL|nr:unnamed protein product [Thelazia callipaeda]